MLIWYRILDNQIGSQDFLKFPKFYVKNWDFSNRSAKNEFIKKAKASLHRNSPIYHVSEGGDDILKIVGGVAFYVEHF